MNKDLHSALGIINETIKDQHELIEHIGIFDGLSGIALFQFYYSMYLDDEDVSDLAVETIGKCIKKINEGYFYPTFCSGITGFTLLLNHLEEQDLIDLEGICLVDFDAHIYNSMIKSIEDRNYDYLHGAIGYASYFLERFKISSLEDSIKYKSYINDFILFLENSSVEYNQGLIWLTKNSGDDKENYNLGLSHGVASILGILRQLSCLKDFKMRCEILLKAAIVSLLKEKNDISVFSSYFPSWVPIPFQEYSKNSRLAWCYGDLGIGVQLLYCSKILKDNDLYDEAISILLHSASRKNEDNTIVEDASICHGAFGIALVFNNIYKNTGILTFKETCAYWLQKGLEISCSDDKLLQQKSVTSKELSFLIGLAGIGLTIISCLSDLNRWEKLLMLDYYE